MPKTRFLVINAGSSTLKFKMFDARLACIISGKFEQYGINSYRFNGSFHNGSEIFNETLNWNALKMDNAIGMIRDRMDSFNELVIGHRVVHGGNVYDRSVIVDNGVKDVIRKYAQLAPLHNPFQLECIDICEDVFKDSMNYAVFDTAFHACLPETSYSYPISFKELNGDIQIRKYGFHGISYQYLLNRLSEYMDKDVKDINAIMLHLGSGCSICCIKNGKSIQTSMGMTPLSGLMMGTRCGDIDSGILFELLKTYDADTIQYELNKNSGLKGICGTNDLRQISSNIDNNPQYKLALDMFIQRINEYIGSYYALLNAKLDAIVLSGGIGQNIHEKPYLMSNLFKDMDGLGIKISQNKPEMNGDIIHLSKDMNTIPILCMETDEELSIANQIMQHKMILKD